LIPLSSVAQSEDSASLKTLMKVKRKELGKPNKPQYELTGSPNARMGDCLVGRGCWKKRMPYCNGADRATYVEILNLKECRLPMQVLTKETN
jgi:hypothetical protein